MEKDRQTIVTLLRGALTARQAKNAAYSLRAMARDFGVSPTQLSLILKGERPVTPENALKWATVLQLNPEQRRTLMEAATRDNHARTDPTERQFRKIDEELKVVQLQLDHFAVIRDWWHYGILNLTQLETFVSDLGWMAHQLGISVGECGEAVQRLVRMGLLEERDGRYQRTLRNLEAPGNVPSTDLRHFHRQNIHRALDSIEAVPVDERDISSIMMPTSKEKLEEARKRIYIFRREMAAFLSDGKAETVYSLNIQLFPQNGRVG